MDSKEKRLSFLTSYTDNIQSLPSLLANLILIPFSLLTVAVLFAHALELVPFLFTGGYLAVYTGATGVYFGYVLSASDNFRFPGSIYDLLSSSGVATKSILVLYASLGIIFFTIGVLSAVSILEISLFSMPLSHFLVTVYCVGTIIHILMLQELATARRGLNRSFVDSYDDGFELASAETIEDLDEESLSDVVEDLDNDIDIDDKLDVDDIDMEEFNLEDLEEFDEMSDEENPFTKDE